MFGNSKSGAIAWGLLVLYILDHNRGILHSPIYAYTMGFFQLIS